MCLVLRLDVRGDRQILAKVYCDFGIHPPCSDFMAFPAVASRPENTTFIADNRCKVAHLRPSR